MWTEVVGELEGVLSEKSLSYVSKASKGSGRQEEGVTLEVLFEAILCESRRGVFLSGILYFGNVMQTSNFLNDHPGMENTSGLLVVWVRMPPPMGSYVLTTRSLVGGTIWGGFGGVDWLEEMSLGVGFGVSKAQDISV